MQFYILNSGSKCNNKCYEVKITEDGKCDLCDREVVLKEAQEEKKKD